MEYKAIITTDGKTLYINEDQVCYKTVDIIKHADSADTVIESLTFSNGKMITLEHPKENTTVNE